jgi:hypothetical protein
MRRPARRQVLRESACLFFENACLFLLEKDVTEQLLELHELSFVSEGDEVLVGRIETGSYAVFPVDGAELLQRIAGGMTLDQAAAWYEDKFGESVDVAEFAETLADLGFVRETGADRQIVQPVRLRLLGRAVFSPAAWVLYGLIFAGWVFAIARDAAVLPHPSQIFFTESLVAVQLGLTLAQIPLLFLHEGFHILAGRRLGLPSRLRVSNRLMYLVFETQLNGLMSVPRSARYLPFVAGILSDALAVCCFGVVAELTRLPSGSFSLVGRFCLAAAFTVVLRMGWQCLLYLRTDLYYVFATALNCYDLHEASTALLRNRLWRALGRAGRVRDEEQWSERDRRVGTFYGPFIILAILASCLLTAFGTFPVARLYLIKIVHNLGTGASGPHFWDAVVSLTLNVTQVVALIWLSRRKRRAAAGRAPRLLQGKED